jgi:hypothetical protein
MGLDYSEFRRLAQSVTNFKDQYDAFLHHFLLEIGMRALADIKVRTPVDTGELRNNWFLSDVVRVGDNLEIYITNNKEYASFVEFGYNQKKRFVPGKWTGDKFIYEPYCGSGMMLKPKWIEGRFMSTIPIAEVNRVIPIKYEAALNQFIRRVGMQ